eukprot:CAMPEP_0171996934 /NCGR_PEP_ID=MMETSP1041-20130122/414_1 /TAXON_ID=464988 /ORGANISM="Hemiselmis andersenii, Strain CCMP439" /LENGTH=107 /DNA_ID=CAMNT_0012650167 /DNA_START=33 /DNA_END=356 /DNA_ORIENTATION=-
MIPIKVNPVIGSHRAHVGPPLPLLGCLDEHAPKPLNNLLHLRALGGLVMPTVCNKRHIIPRAPGGGLRREPKPPALEADYSRQLHWVDVPPWLLQCQHLPQHNAERV